MDLETHIPLSQWAEDDLPREKLIKHGAASLSVNELIAVILRSGVRGETALELARRIYADCGNDLHRLARLGVNELMNKYKGVGIAKAAGLVVALELSRRRENIPSTLPRNITSSESASKHFIPLMQDLDHEEFWCLFLNKANKVLGIEKLSSGGIAGTVVDVRMLFAKALEIKATGIIVAHNHPSGNLHPGAEDTNITKKISQGGKILDILLMDHLIIGCGKYYSFADEGMLPT